MVLTPLLLVGEELSYHQPQQNSCKYCIGGGKCFSGTGCQEHDVGWCCDKKEKDALCEGDKEGVEDEEKGRRLEFFS